MVDGLPRAPHCFLQVLVQDSPPGSLGKLLWYIAWDISVAICWVRIWCALAARTRISSLITVSVPSCAGIMVTATKDATTSRSKDTMPVRKVSMEMGLALNVVSIKACNQHSHLIFKVVVLQAMLWLIAEHFRTERMMMVLASTLLPITVKILSLLWINSMLVYNNN